LTHTFHNNMHALKLNRRRAYRSFLGFSWDKLKRKLYGFLFLTVLSIVGFSFALADDNKIGEGIDNYKGVAIYNNGSNFTANHGTNYSSDGYYFGEKWQCVEFVKRFYYVVKGHSMPNVFGNAKDFFNEAIPQGGVNEDRGLIQYKNCGDVPPKVNDILVFTDGRYGHVAIVTKVNKDLIEIVQQNCFEKTRESLKLFLKMGSCIVGEKRKPAGWLRLKEI